MSRVNCTFCSVEFNRKGRPKRHNFCSKKHFYAWNSVRISNYNSTENPINKQESWTAERRNRWRKICLERGGNHAYKKVHGKHTHRVVAEMLLCRELLPNEVVHHKNFNHLDNSPENIEVMTRSEHARLHSREYWRTRKGGDANEIQRKT